MPGMIYAMKLLVSPSMDIFKYQGIVPALKYMVITKKRYQNFLCHICCLVTRYPTKAEAITISAVPSMVLPIATTNASPISFAFTKLT